MTIFLPNVEKMRAYSPKEKVAQLRAEFNQASAQSTSNTPPRKVIFLGPCSIHNPKADLELALHIQALQKEYPDFLFVFRAHLEKPRSSHFWRGFLLDPSLDGSCRLEEGVTASREFLLQLIELNIPTSYEFIDPFLAPYVEDLITVGLIGARTVYSQTHRQLAASLSMPVIFKNSLDGRLDGALDACQVAQKGLITPKLGLSGPELVFAKNPYTHLMLRGGHDGSNIELLESAHAAFKELDLTGSVFIDCAHQNSSKDPDLQLQLLEQLLTSPTKASGFMVECHLQKGSQSFSATPAPGLSITDPCIAISAIEALMKNVTAEWSCHRS